MPEYPSLDQMILGSQQGTLLTPVCAKEVYVLRTVGIKWQQLAKIAADAHKDLMQHPGGIGSVDFMLYITRKVSQGSVIQTVEQSIQIPREIFEWPLPR